MSSSKTAYRKVTGSFLNDHSKPNLFQQHHSPRPDQAATERHRQANGSSSKTNFMGDLTPFPEGPRAVNVTHTGEKHSLEDDLNAACCPNTSSNQGISYTLNQSESVNMVPSVSYTNVSSPKIPTFPERSRSCSGKRSKSSRRYMNQKPRTIFTPRGCEKSTPRHARTEEKHQVIPSHNAETQTELAKQQIFLPPSLKFTAGNPANKPLEVPQRSCSYTSRRLSNDSIGDVLDATQRHALRLLPEKKKSLKNLSELRSIASALTLITVVSWLFSTFFDLDGILEMLGELVEYIQEWYVKKEQPVTKMEALLQYMHDFFWT